MFSLKLFQPLCQQVQSIARRSLHDCSMKNLSQLCNQDFQASLQKGFFTLDQLMQYSPEKWKSFIAVYNHAQDGTPVTHSIEKGLCTLNDLLNCPDSVREDYLAIIPHSSRTFSSFKEIYHQNDLSLAMK